MSGRTSTIEACARFNAIDLHDSKLLNVSIMRRGGDDTDEVRLELRIVSGKHPDFSWTPAELRFLQTAYVKIAFDLGAKLECGHAIDSNRCAEGSELSRQIEGGSWRYVNDPFSGCLQFSLFLCPPGGEMHVLAEDFQFEITSPLPD